MQFVTNLSYVMFTCLMKEACKMWESTFSEYIIIVSYEGTAFCT